MSDTMGDDRYEATIRSYTNMVSTDGVHWLIDRIDAPHRLTPSELQTITAGITERWHDDARP